MVDFVFCCRGWQEEKRFYPLADQWSIQKRKKKKRKPHYLTGCGALVSQCSPFQNSDSIAVGFSQEAKSHCSDMSLCHRSRGELECVHDSTCIPVTLRWGAEWRHHSFFFFHCSAVPYNLSFMNVWDREIVEQETEHVIWRIVKSLSTLNVFIAMKSQCPVFYWKWGLLKGA